MNVEALHSFEDQGQRLDTHQERTDELLSRLDDEAIQDLAETGTVEDVRAVVEILIEKNPELSQYLVEFQEANSQALAMQLQKSASTEVSDNQTENDEVSKEEMHELIQKAQEYLYNSLDIDENRANNGVFTNFAKGVVDTLIFENGDLALQVIETKGEIILDALKQLATWNGIKQLLQALGESIWDLFEGDAYEKGKAVADLGLVATGVGVTSTLGRNAVKSAMRNIDTPLVHNLDKIFFDNVDTLPNTERIDFAKEVLGNELTPNQENTIISAHNIGERMENGKYSFGDIREKFKILKQGGFSSQEIRLLLENNICGSDLRPNIRIQNLNISIKYIESIDGFNSLFDPNKGNIIKDGISHQDILELVSSNEKLSELFSIYKVKNGNVSDPDAFRELFPNYSGINSSNFDDITQKLSKIYYSLQLLEIQSDINAKVRLLGGAPGSGKSTSIKHLDTNNSRLPDTTFDAPLSDIRFIDYLKSEAQSAGINNIDIDIIHRDPVKAWEGIVERAIKSKRPVGASYYIETYAKVRGVMEQLIERNEPSIRFIDNSGSPQDVKQVGLDEISTYSTTLSKGELDRITRRIVEKSINDDIIESNIGIRLREELLK